ncbi:raftlin-2 isoform X2 [Oncorhynchus kisutch]|uniref:raftlin-2 isoform X2 n=1 Tax=Oncorhynchus kisutch TaxID=8019 RepID=UPI0012DCAAA8|nr:raftlin-2 isoform X2 [Oncorhynchus kisutch]
MGCGLRKLEDPEDSSPGKIYSTLKRPQVETITDTVYEYVLLDFSLEGSRPTVQYMSSLCELPQALQPYYIQGYVLTTLHPIILSVGRTRSLPFSMLYRAILTRPRPSKQAVSMCHSVSVLRVEEWPITGQSLTGDNVRALIDRVNSRAQGGVRFVGSVLQPARGGASNDRMPSPRRGCRSLPRTPPCTPPGDGHTDLEEHSPTNSPGEPVPRSLEGLFVYEERSTAPPANDTIVVEQWIVIEGSDVKTDYGPLLHTLAEFGWLLTCVLPTHIIRHDSDGNLATKHVVFLQRPIKTSSIPQRNHAGSIQSDVSTGSVSRGVGSPLTPPNVELTPTAGGIGGFPVFGGGYPSTLSHLEGGFEHDDGAAEVTCM